MGFYAKHILPWGLHLACGVKPVRYQRRKVIPLARGRVLEVGIGSGLNLPFYDAGKVERVIGLDPSAEMRRLAEKAVKQVPFPVEFIGLSGEDIPLEKASVDTVVVTYTLCTIPDAVAALREMRRVLKPGGELVFTEHGLAPDAKVRRVQERIEPVWKRLAGGCHLTRPIPDLIRAGGFRMTQVETMYIPGWKPLCFNYWGCAVEG
ncbi:MAG: class I SAM-dependent methyltransferase [Alphaproteobacteria bacterium]|nr:class I SAM-dependent methyltransferase [Alphaproteobacteria bacterium]